MKTTLFALLALVVAVQLSCAPAPTTGGLAGTATLSGEVSATVAFKAAQVYAKNIDKRMLYMVYSSKGRYRAINLLPGNYEIWVEKRGFAPVQAKQLRLQAGDRMELDFPLSVADEEPMTLGHRSARYGGVIGKDTPLVPYEQLNPAGPGRVLAERTCMVCHGENFLPTHQMNTEEWDAVIGLMMDPNMRAGPQIIEGNAVGTITAEQRRALAEYLSLHFGPDSERRALKIEVDIPLDEDALANAMIIEYFLPEGRKAHDPAIDSEGNVWYSDGAVPTRIGKLDPRTAEFTQYDLPEPNSTRRDSWSIRVATSSGANPAAVSWVAWIREPASSTDFPTECPMGGHTRPSRMQTEIYGSP